MKVRVAGSAFIMQLYWMNLMAIRRPLDYGAGFLAGYEFFLKLSVQCNAQIGLANLVPEFGGFQSKDKLKNTNFGISAGYKF